jgi:hypothetical protein
MKTFMAANPGLAGRLTRTIEFPDYSPSELARIFFVLCEMYRYHLSAGLEPAVGTYMAEIWCDRGANFANGRAVRSLFEGKTGNSHQVRPRGGSSDPHNCRPSLVVTIRRFHALGIHATEIRLCSPRGRLRTRRCRFRIYPI